MITVPQIWGDYFLPHFLMEYELRQTFFEHTQQWVISPLRCALGGLLMLLAIPACIIRKFVHFVVLPFQWNHPRRPPSPLSVTTRSIAKGGVDVSMAAITLIAFANWIW